MLNKIIGWLIVKNLNVRVQHFNFLELFLLTTLTGLLEAKPNQSHKIGMSWIEVKINFMTLRLIL